MNKIPTKIFDLDVKPPSMVDAEWAERIKNMSSKKLGFMLFEEIGNNNIWRILYLLSIPKSDTLFDHKGTKKETDKLALDKAIEYNKLDVAKALAYHKVPLYSRYATCDKIRRNKGYDVFNFLITKAKYTEIAELYYRSDSYDREQSLTAAVHSRNIDMVKLIAENGANLSLYLDVMDLAKTEDLPEIYKYLEQKIRENNARFEEFKPKEDQVKLLEKPTSETGISWEKISDQIIAEHHILEDGQSNLSYIFNFRLCQMTALYKSPPSMSNLETQNFKDIEGIENQINEAFDTLVDKGGHPSEYKPDFIKKPTKTPALKIEK